MMKRLLVAGGIGGVYHSFIQLALAKGYSITALLQNPTFLGSIKVPPRMSYPRDFPTLKVEYPENYDAELIDKMAAVLFINYTDDVAAPNEYFDLVEQLVPSMLLHKVKKLVMVASDGPMINQTLKNILEYIANINNIDEVVIKYNRNKDQGYRIDLKQNDYVGYIDISSGFNYKIPDNDQGYMHPFHISPVIIDAIQNDKLNNKIVSVCRPSRFTP